MFNLKSLLRRRNVRRKHIELRSIEVTGVLEGELSRIVARPIRQWSENVAQLILPLFVEASEQLAATKIRVGDAPADPLKVALSMSEASALRIVLATEPQLREWLTRFEKWHTRSWTARVVAGTDIDIFPFIDLHANAPQIEAFRERIGSLIRGLNDDTRKSVEEVTWKGFLEQTPRREMGKILSERLSVSRARANFIAIDQSNKTAAELTKIRQQEAGIDSFVWETAKDDRVRPEHAALQGKIFKWDTPPSIGLPGTPPRCRCMARAYVDLEGT